MTSNSVEDNESVKEQIQERDQTIDSFKRLDNISHNWFQFIEDFLDNNLKPNFEVLCQTIGENNDLLKTIETKHKTHLKGIISKSNLTIDEKTSEELTETDLINHSIALKSSKESLSSELLSKKELKSQLSDKTKSLTKQLEQMESTTKLLKKQNDTNNSNEYLTLAAVMRVMYKMWNNSKVVGLLFKDNEEKSLERLIVIDRDNKTEEQMAEQFWDSLNKDYAFE